MTRNSFFVAFDRESVRLAGVRTDGVNSDSWPEPKGLTVTSLQKVVAKPTKLRLFATLAETDPDVKKAVAKLADSKKTAIDKLLAIGVKKDAIEFAETRIHEWDETEQGGMMGMGMFNVDTPERVIPLSREAADEDAYTAFAAVQVEWEIKDLDGDALILKSAEPSPPNSEERHLPKRSRKGGKIASRSGGGRLVTPSHRRNLEQ